uniref:Uncharacterized protein n=1 Tax=Rhodosorus marinus TaxID=101924 RepID=A0A7S2ZXW2_9RHOD
MLILMGKKDLVIENLTRPTVMRPLDELETLQVVLREVYSVHSGKNQEHAGKDTVDDHGFAGPLALFVYLFLQLSGEINSFRYPVEHFHHGVQRHRKPIKTNIIGFNGLGSLVTRFL